MHRVDINDLTSHLSNNLYSYTMENLEMDSIMLKKIGLMLYVIYLMKRPFWRRSSTALMLPLTHS